jgi:tetratricopeptide (TPR) repeat protein
MQSSVQDMPMARRKLLLRDSLGIFVLLVTTGALFAVTYFLFRSFSVHRAELATRWSERGSAALKAGKPDDAITDLRAALVYAPGTREYELPLAEALGQTGRPEQAEESYQYFMNLWAAEPGYGPINLQLARLERKRNRPQDAINFYRAAIYGTWEGGGVAQRAEVRLELAQYLIEQNDAQAARMELLIAGGDAEDDYGRDMRIGGLLEQASDADDAESYYRRALKAHPRDEAARAAIARLEAAQAAAEAAAVLTSAQANDAVQSAQKNAARGSEKANAKPSRREHTP